MSKQRGAEIALAFNAATLLFALPLYVRVFSDPGFVLVLRLMALFQLIPTAVLVLLGMAARRFGGPRIAGMYWAALTAGAVLSLLRVVQLQAFSMTLAGLPWWGKALVALAFGVPLALAVVFARRALLALSRQLTPAVIFVTVAFVAQLSLPHLTGAGGTLTKPTRQDTVLFIIFDEMGRDVLTTNDRLDPVRFPNLARLAADGVWFTNATSNYGVTCASVPSLLTGKRITEINCQERGLADLDPSVLTRLADEYRVSIYDEVLPDCHGVVVRYQCRGIPYLVAKYPQLALVEHLIPPTARTSVLADLLGGTHTPFALPMWREFLADLESGGGRGGAYFVHIALPHSPFIFDERGRLHHDPNEYFLTLPENEPATFANYDRQTRFTDRLFGELVETLKRKGLYDTATILVTGDHGPWAAATAAGAISRMSPQVPVILKSPSLRPGLSAVEYQHIDLAPTLLSVLNLRPLEGVDGRAAFGAALAPRDKTFILGKHGAGNPFRSRDYTTFVQSPGSSEWRPAP